MLDKLSAQQRMVIAMAISVLFFIAYDYFFIPKKEIKQEQNTTQVQEQKDAPKVQNDSPKVVTKSPQSSASSDMQHIATVKSEHFELKIDNLGRIDKFFLNDSKFKQDGIGIQLIDQKASAKPLEIRFSDANLNNEAFAMPYSVDKSSLDLSKNENTLTLKQSLSELEITKIITFKDDGSYDIKISLSDEKDYFITPGSRPNIMADSYTFHGVLIKKADETLEVIDDGDAKGESFNNASIVSATDRYYATLFYSFSDGLHAIVSPVGEESEVFIRGKKDMNFSGFIGPKEYKTLNSINKNLTDVIEYGFFTIISKPMFKFLSFLHQYLGNWGWAIVFMTLVIRLVLFPLTYKGMVSMNKLKEIAPKIKEIQAKYKGDPQKMNTHVMELYKKHGANPMGGCLPIIMQIPIFFAIYRVLLNTIELKAAPWILWVHDLSVMDPYFILPIAMGVTMYLQQRITPTNFTDPMQEKIMKFLPLIFTFFFVSFPAGLTLYWFINNLFSMAQQAFVNHIFAKQKLEKKAE